MGAVYRVRQPKLNRLAALKLLPRSLSSDSAFAGRFEREAQLLARLSHPNIVGVFDFGQASGYFYLLMEYVDGVNLRQAMRASRFSPDQALAIVPKICEALQYAHEEGVLHRDIKPENILLDGKGRVKLADFGIAKLIEDPESPLDSTAEQDASFTHAGAALGTPSYMAPEQRTTPAAVDQRADIYSLGVVFYELLTGELPSGQFAAPSEKCAADPRVDAIVQQALEKERERRQGSAEELRTQVAAITESPVSAPANASTSAPRSATRVLVAVAAILCTIFGGWIHQEVEPAKAGVGNSVPVTITTIGAVSPWLSEFVQSRFGGEPEHWFTERVWNLGRSPWEIASCALMLATVLWRVWFHLKWRDRQSWDSSAYPNRDGLHWPSAFGLWIGSSTFAWWLCLVLLGLWVWVSKAVFGHVNPEPPLALHSFLFVSLLVSSGWTAYRVRRAARHAEERLAPVESGVWRVPVGFAALLLLLLAYASIAQSSRDTKMNVAPSAAKVETATKLLEQQLAAGTDVTLQLIEKSSHEDHEVRQVGVSAAKPGFLHLWHESGPHLVKPLLPDSTGRLSASIFYVADARDPAALTYQINGEGSPPRGQIPIKGDALSLIREMREIRDPSGKCLRDVPLDIGFVNDRPLLLAVTFTPELPVTPPLYLHIWSPTLYTTPPTMPRGLDSVVVKIGEILTTPGQPQQYRQGVKEGQRLGRISQRDGGFCGNLQYDFGTSTAMLNDTLVLEQPVYVKNYSMSGGIFPVVMVLSEHGDMTEFLRRQVRIDERNAGVSTPATPPK